MSLGDDDGHAEAVTDWTGGGRGWNSALLGVIEDPSAYVANTTTLYGLGDDFGFTLVALTAEGEPLDCVSNVAGECRLATLVE